MCLIWLIQQPGQSKPNAKGAPQPSLQRPFDQVRDALYQKKSYITSTTWPVIVFTSKASS